MTTSQLEDNRAAEGANLYLDAGSTTTYVLPAPPGYWVPATKCEVWREACDEYDDTCKAAAERCKGNFTDNVNSCNKVTSGYCKPTTFNQPCDWRNNPDLLGKTVYRNAPGQTFEHHMKYCPTTMPGGSGWDKPMYRPADPHGWINASELHRAWGLLLDAAEAGRCAVASPLIFDIVDVGREFLSVVPCVAAYDALVAASTAPAVREANATMVELLADLDMLLGHEEVIEDRLGTRVEKLRWRGFYKPIIVDDATGTILDGHHKTAASRQLGLSRVAVLPVDYLGDQRIAVDVWPGCGRDRITKEEVIAEWVKQMLILDPDMDELPDAAKVNTCKRPERTSIYFMLRIGTKQVLMISQQQFKVSESQAKHIIQTMHAAHLNGVSIPILNQAKQVLLGKMRLATDYLVIHN